MRLPRRRTLRAASTWVQRLNLYRSAGVTAFAWAVAEAIGWDAGPYLLLWFLGALFAYNLECFRIDPAYHWNLPRRIAGQMLLRWIALAIALCSGFLLIWLPWQRHDWTMLALAVVGIGLCAAYSFPFFGRQLKVIPLLTTFFPPSIVTLATFLPPLVQQGLPYHVGTLLFGFSWSLAVLFSHRMLSDLRDLRGDQRTGILTLPGLMGKKRTVRLLWGLIGCTLGLATMLAMLPGTASRGVWIANALLVPAYFGWLVTLARTRRPAHYHEWSIEGVLVIPAIILFFLR